MCDGVSDCNLGDDEFFCFPKLPPCPQNCSCVIYSISCQHSLLRKYHHVVPFVHIVILHSYPDALTNFFKEFKKAVVLSLSHNNLVKLCPVITILPNKHELAILIAAHNNIITVDLCFNDFSGIRYLDLSWNLIKSLKQFSFSKLLILKVLDFSGNGLETLQHNAFTGLSKLDVLILNENLIRAVATQALQGSSIKYISTDNFKVCCIKPMSKTLCNAQAPWPYSCSLRLLTSITQTGIVWVITLIGILLNTFALIINMLKISKEKQGVGYNYSITVLGIVIVDLSACMNLFIIAVADLNYGDSYFTNEYSWRGSLLCYAGSFLSISFQTMSFFVISFIALSRFYLVKNPFDTIFLNPSFIKRCMFIFVTFTLISSLGIILSSRYSLKSFLLPTGICLIIV